MEKKAAVAHFLTGPIRVHSDRGAGYCDCGQILDWSNPVDPDASLHQRTCTQCGTRHVRGKEAAERAARIKKKTLERSFVLQGRMHDSSMRRMAIAYENFFAPMLEGNPDLLPTVLDLGSQDVNGCYRDIFPAPWQYLGLDLEAGKNVDIVLADPYHWAEIEPGKADVIISGQTLEHVEFFWITMTQMACALRPGGLLCIIVPSGGPEHKYPVDCYRFYPDGLRAMAKYARLDVLSAETAWGDGAWADSVLVARKPL